MRSRGEESLYRHRGVALLRAAAVPLGSAPDRWPDPSDPEDCRVWLQTVWQSPHVVEAVRQASPGLADRVEAITTNNGGTKATRRAALAVARYLLRATGRQTPFGLFAGVAPVVVASAARASWGDDHRPVARADAQWLAAVVDRLEACPQLLARLDVVFTSLAVRRGGRLEAPQGAGRVTIRYTDAVRAARDASASPVRFDVLVDELAGAFPSADRVKVQGMLTELVRQGFLVTCLRAPLTVTDPLGHVLERLDEVAAASLEHVAPLLAELRAIRSDIWRHNDARTSARGRARQLADVSRRMRGISRAGRTPLAVDLRLDCDVHLPDHVVHEVERAASALVRLTRQPTGPAPWRDYYTAFCERYGTGTLVPLADVVDHDVGLGYPAGYPGSTIDTVAAGPSERDEKLLALAWVALAAGRREITLTDEQIDDLSAGESPGGRRIPAHVEVAARVHATSVEALENGDYTLTVAPARSAGTLTSRFTPIVPESGVEDVLRTAPTAVADALPVQLSFPAAYTHAENVCRVPAYLPQVLSLGEHRGYDDTPIVPVEDLAVTATREGLHLVSVSRGRVVEPQVFHALALDKQAPTLARFLAHLPRGLSAAWTELDWGPTGQRLPFLPRVRYGRAVLSPARWHLTATDLPTGEPGLQAGRHDLDRWRQRWNCPEDVELRDADQSLRLRLDEPAHAAILRAHLRRHGTATLTEASPATALAWINGHAHDLVVPLTSTLPPASAVRLDRLPHVANRHGHLPGAPGAAWLAAKVFSHPDRHDEIIAEHLPRLAAALGGTPRWWFVRYRSPHESDHLRLRFHVQDRRDWGEHVCTIGEWAEQLRHDGLTSRLVFDTYYPEVGRYGLTDGAMAAAEDVFAADSQAVAVQLRCLSASAIHPLVLAALGMVDITSGFLGDIAEATRWLVSRPAPRHVSR